MRDAETILAIINERGKKGLHLERVYRLLFNRDLFLWAYGRIYRNDGAMTQGSTEETVDGMSLRKIDAIIDLLCQERYRWTPVRRTYIPKANGKTRPLGIPTWSDKLLQEVMRTILEAYFEPQFSGHSHGFRPGKGCQTALAEVHNAWTGTKWFIEGDIKGCFDNIDHKVMLAILREKIHDGRFLNLIEGLLEAGYLEEWKYNRTLSGTPQGGILSPFLANIYLDRLDRYVEGTLIPEYTRGKNRKTPNEYIRVFKKMKSHLAKGEDMMAEEMRKALKAIPSRDYHDPNYRRLRFIRYADDFLLGLTGPKDEAEEIKEKLTTFLRNELKLEMSKAKTLISHAVEEPARFLGYEICVRRSDERPTINGYISLRLPIDKLKGFCDRYRKEGKPIQRTYLIDNSDFSIVEQYGQEYRGIVQYYRMADNVGWMARLHWIMRRSLLKTLARKHKTTARKMTEKYSAKDGRRTCLEVIIERGTKPPLKAIFGEASLKPDRWTILLDYDPRHVAFDGNHTELIQRLLADTCECCESKVEVEVHHIRHLKDLMIRGQQTPRWKLRMAAIRRKTLVVCKECHDRIHAGLETKRPQTLN